MKTIGNTHLIREQSGSGGKRILKDSGDKYHRMIENLLKRWGST
jgi:hypothetical protein